MVNPSTLATAAASAVAAAIEPGTAAPAAGSSAAGQVRRAEARAAATTARHTSNPVLKDPVAAATVGRAVGLVRNRGPRVAVPGWAPAHRPSGTSSSSRTSSSSSKSALSFLSDPKLSIEEKLMRLLAHLSEKWEKEMQSKMDQIGAAEGDTSGSGTKSKTTKKKTGFLGTIASAVSKAVPGLDTVLGALNIPGVKTVLGKIGGPVLAAAASALGFPAAAPLLLKYGSSIVGAAAGVASASGSSSSSAASGTGAMTDGKRQQLVMEVQRLYEKQKEMFGLVSNILRTSHDTRMATINNIR